MHAAISGMQSAMAPENLIGALSRYDRRRRKVAMEKLSATANISEGTRENDGAADFALGRRKECLAAEQAPNKKQ